MAVTRHHQKGAALIVVLLILALITVIAANLGSSLQLSIRRAENQQEYQQAYWYAQGGERLARELIESALTSDGRIHLGQAWASSMLRYPIEGGLIRLSIKDRRTCFNLNGLASLNTPHSADSEANEGGASRHLSALLSLMEFEPREVEAMVEPLRDWLDSDTLPTGFHGAEDLYYTSRKPPYLPANSPLVSMSELNYIKGFSSAGKSLNDDELERLSILGQMLCAVPSDRVTINLNTLQPENAAVLAALFEDKVLLQDIDEWLAHRPSEGVGNVEEFWSMLTEGKNDVKDLDVAVKEHLSVSSDFFCARVEVNYRNTRLLMYSNIHVRDGKTYVYQRQYGELERWPDGNSAASELKELVGGQG